MKNLRFFDEDEEFNPKKRLNSLSDIFLSRMENPFLSSELMESNPFKKKYRSPLIKWQTEEETEGQKKKESLFKKIFDGIQKSSLKKVNLHDIIEKFSDYKKDAVDKKTDLIKYFDGLTTIFMNHPNSFAKEVEEKSPDEIINIGKNTRDLSFRMMVEGINPNGSVHRSKERNAMVDKLDEMFSLETPNEMFEYFSRDGEERPEVILKSLPLSPEVSQKPSFLYPKNEYNMQPLERYLSTRNAFPLPDGVGQIVYATKHFPYNLRFIPAHDENGVWVPMKNIGADYGDVPLDVKGVFIEENPKLDELRSRLDHVNEEALVRPDFPFEYLSYPAVYPEKLNPQALNLSRSHDRNVLDDYQRVFNAFEDALNAPKNERQRALFSIRRDDLKTQAGKLSADLMRNLYFNLTYYDDVEDFKQLVDDYLQMVRKGVDPRARTNFLRTPYTLLQIYSSFLDDYDDESD